MIEIGVVREVASEGVVGEVLEGGGGVGEPRALCTSRCLVASLESNVVFLSLFAVNEVCG